MRGEHYINLCCKRACGQLGPSESGHYREVIQVTSGASFTVTITAVDPCTHMHYRTYVSSRPLFQELNTLLAYLGAPTYRRRRTLANAHSTLIGSQLEEFLDSMANECDEKTLRIIKAKEIFYQVWMRKMEGKGKREENTGWRES